MNEIITVSERQLAELFNEWDRRFRADPEKFISEAYRLLKQTPETYGDACAPYFISLYKEMAWSDL